MAGGRILVIAGSDSSGGAGLEADQKVIAAHGCYAMTTTTALTAQNTTGVLDIHYVPPQFIRKSIEACISDIGVDVVKTGMLASAEVIVTISEALRKHDVKTIVVDPVVVSTTGSILLPQEAIKELREHLLPVATILTPNVPEAQLILKNAGLAADDPKDVDGLISIAKLVQSLGPKYVLVKGGHLPLKDDGTIANSEEDRKRIVNILYGEDQVTRIETPYQKSSNTHGTGCSLASAIASNIANGDDVVTAVRRGIKYVEEGIKTAPKLGHGNGPINHFHSIYTLPFAPGGFVQYLLERTDVQKFWREHTEHDFVAGLADGTLPVAAFKRFLTQDYLYLTQFARASALASYKAKTIEDIAASAKIVLHIHHEMALHINYCKEFGMTKEEMEATEESEATTAYSRYILDIGQSQDWFALQMAQAPCLLGYGDLAQRIYNDPKSKKIDNIYWKWVENYVADDFTEAVAAGSALLEKHAVSQSPSRIEELVQIFIQATRMETGFWDMGKSAGA